MNKKLSRALSISATIVTMIFGILVIIGWFTHNDFLRSIVPGAVKMKFNVALNFIFASVVLLFYHSGRRSNLQQVVSVFLCVLISLTGLLTLLEYILRVNLGIDELFVRDELRTTAIYYAGRMSPISALNFLQIGVGLLLLNKEKAITYQFFYLFEIAFVAMLMLISLNFVTDIPTFFRLAIHGAIGFITLPTAIFFAQPILQEKINFEYLMLTGFISVILLTLVISLYSFYYNNELIRSSRLVEHTHNVMIEAEKILSFTKDIESGARGYVIFNDSIYLEHFVTAKENIFRHVIAIKELAKDNLSQRLKIDSLAPLISKRIDFSQHLIQSRYEQGFKETYGLMATRKGKIYADRIRELIHEIQKEENNLLIQRQKKNNESISAFNFAFRTLLVGMVTLLVAIFFIIRYNLTKRRKAEKQSKESEKQIQHIFRAAPDAVITMDGAGRIAKWNLKAETLFGWTEGEVIGRLLSDTVIPHRYRDAHQKGLRHFARSGEGPVLNKTVEIQALRKDNNEFDIALSISPTMINGEHLFIGFIRDITEQKNIEAQIQRQKQEMQAFIDSMSTLCAKVSTEGKLLLVNKTAMLATGLSMDELLNINFLAGNWWTFDSEVHSRVSEAFKNACSGIACNYDENIFAFGQVLTINFSLIPILKPNGTVDYIVAEGRDITPLKITENELLKQANRLEAVNKELEAFSYSVSHDLRAPLRAIHGYTKMLSEDYVDQLDDRAKQMMGSVLRNAAKMGRLIDELLAFSKLGKKELHLTSIDMTKLVASVLNDLKYSLVSTKANIVVLPLLPANADSNLMNQVFVNLISNAIKYSAVKDAPAIEIGSREEESEAIYYVKDNGVGFDMKYYDKLFGVFQRLHRDEEFEGTGVGLALVKRIVTRHNGKVWAEAEPGKGATFYFSLSKR